MKLLLSKATACLAAGAIANVVFSWVCALDPLPPLVAFGLVTGSYEYPSAEDLVWWSATRPSQTQEGLAGVDATHHSLGRSVKIYVGDMGGLYSVSREGEATIMGMNGPRPPQAVAIRVRCGFPLCSFSGARWMTIRNGGPSLSLAEVAATGLYDWRGRHVPIGLDSRGIVLNSLLFAVAMLGVVLGVSSAKRWIRIQGGCCGQCGYLLCQEVRCPECGTRQARESRRLAQ